jgi:hypothetical protein
VKKGAAVGIATAKRSDTAELRKRFGSINAFLADGYNHKQICAHLNTQGLAIPYPQYRAIMTRLRRETEKDAKLMPAVVHSIQSAMTALRQRTSEVPLVESAKENSQVKQDKKILWDPMSEVKWK